MELKVDVEGLERSVSGINERTTCAQIIYALAHATAQKGRFVMIEKFHNVERRLSAEEKPMELIQKHREHPGAVQFILRKLEEPTVDQLSKPIEDLTVTPSLMSFRNNSNSSVLSERVQRPAHTTSASAKRSTPPTNPNFLISLICETLSLGLSSYSTASLPGFQGTLTRKTRPPPPDYKTVMEQKFSSLSRNSGRTMLDGAALMKMPYNELVALVERQRHVLEKQREARETQLASHVDRELLQLEKQQENLRLVLGPMRSQNLPQLYEQELKRSHKLRATIEATKEAIDKTKRDVEKMQREEEQLLHDIESVEDNSFEITYSIDSPQKMLAI